MRLLRLDLHAFGAFEDVSLALGRSDGAEPGLTIVYGPNEAGKSTALRAVRQLFFGIEGDRDAFRTAKAKLRIGGLLRGDDGAECGGVRRGSRTDWIYDADDKKRQGDDSPFAALLARLDATSYETAYGLDHDALKSGAEAIAASDGNLDAALFAATARVKDLQGFHRDLVERSDNLFTPQARTGKTINRLLGELSKLNEEASKAKQPIEDFRRLRTDLERVRSEVETLERERSELDARLALYRRYADLFGDHVARRGLATELDELSDVPLLGGELEARWDALKNETSEAKVRAESAAATRDATEKELASLGESSPLVAHGERIDALARRALLSENERLEVENDARERVRLARAADEALAAIGDLATRADLEALALPQNFAETIRKLVDERRDLDNAESADRTRLQQMQDRLRELDACRERDDLDDRLARFDQVIRAAEEAAKKGTQERDGIAEAVRAKSSAVQEWIAARFVSPIEPARLPAIAIPSLETIEEEIERRKRFDDELKAMDGRRREIVKDLIDVERRLDAAAAENLPSPDDLIAKRAVRDEALRRLRTRLLAPPSEGRSPSEGGETVEGLIASLTEAVHEADRVADVLAMEAERCAQVKQDRLEAEALRKRREAIEGERIQLSDEVRRVEEAWSNLWSVVGVRASSPKEMRSWRREWESRCDDVADIAANEAQLRLLEEGLRAAFANLIAELRDLDVEPATTLDSTSPSKVLLAARSARTKLEAGREQAAKDRGERERLVERDIPARVEALRLTSERKADWHDRWERAAKRLPEASRAAPRETLSFLDQFAVWRGLRDQERAIEDRRIAFDAKIRRFEADVATLAADLGEPAPRSDAMAKVRRWTTDLAEARLRDNEAAKLLLRLDKARDDVAAADERLRVADRKLDEFREELGVRDAQEISPRLQSIRRKRLVLDKAGELDDRLNRLLPEWTWEALARELTAWSPETLDAEMEALSGQIERTSAEAKSRYVRLGELQDERKKWDGTSRAAEIEQSKQRLLAELSEAAELYATYRLAASALEVSIERYREKNKSPVLERAGKHFARLTLGRYSGLEPHDAPEGGIAVVGIRGSAGEEPREVPVSGMSRGTCDQLYLAFRMALWEERLEKGSPLPIVLDDVLVHFDDERAAATLKAFDELAKRTQIVYFTHHRHLVELAKKTLPADRLLVRELQPPGVRS